MEGAWGRKCEYFQDASIRSEYILIMKIFCDHIGFNVTDLNIMKDLYVRKLGMELVEEFDSFYAVKAGNVKFSFGGGYKKNPKNEDSTGIVLFLKTADLFKTRDMLIERSVKLISDITDEKGYKYLTIEDPDGNLVHIGQQ